MVRTTKLVKNTMLMTLPLIEMMGRWEELDKQYPCGEIVRTQEYVEEQCRQMVDQLIEYDRPLNKFKRWLRERIQDILDTIRRIFNWENW